MPEYKLDDKVATELIKAFDAHASITAEFKKQLETVGTVSSEAKELAVKITSDMTAKLEAANKDVQKRVDDLQAQVVRQAQIGNAQDERKSIGELVTGTEAFKQHDFSNRMAKQGYSVQIEKKNIITDPTQPSVTVPRYRVPGVTQIPNQQLLIRDIIPTGTTTSNVIEFVKENVLTLQAGPQWSPGTSPAWQDGAKKNQSDISYTLVTVPVTTLAHFIKASKQMLSDTPFLNSEISGRLMYGLELKEEQEILNGSGVSGDILGLIPQAPLYQNTYAKGNDTKIDKARHAMLQVALQKFLPSAHIMSVLDWHDIETAKDGTLRYLIGDPRGVVGQILWGLPVAASLSMAPNTHLVGDFQSACQLFDRMTYTVSIGYEMDDFTRNMVTMLAEERIALAVYQPKALLYNPSFT
jgi:HK97 family phage major capsid protein